MIGALVIVFREVIEAALVVGIVAAAVKGLPRRGRRVCEGVALGVAGAAAVAVGLGFISHLEGGRGQELFQAAVLLLAGLLLAWHNLYMASHGRAVARHLTTLGGEVLAGTAPVTMLIGVTAIAVMREGSEVALFLFALVAGGTSGINLLTGALIGLLCGVAVGFVLYLGLSRISIRRLFQVSGWIILFIAAGMIARSAEYLVAIGYLPALAPRIWDSSALLSGSSIVGRSLSALVGYTPSPSLMQVAVWCAALLGIGGWMLAIGRRGRFPKAAGQMQ